MSGLLNCPFCGSGNIEIHGMPAVMEAPDTAQCADCNACAEAGNWNTRVAIKAGQVEAVAWMLADAVGGSMLEFQRDLLLENQCRYGGEVVPLYTAPPATGVIVPRELLERAIERIELNTHYPFGEPQTPRDAENRMVTEELRALLAQLNEVKS